jgi:hypothetical protein
MSDCVVDLPGGNNTDCKIPISEVENILITDKDVKIAWANRNTLASYTNLVNQSLTIYGNVKLENYAVTTDDPTVTTAPVSKVKSVSSSLPAPSFEFMVSANTCDFTGMLNTLKGGTYGIWLVLKGKKLHGYVDQSGSDIGYLKPFTANVTAFFKGAAEIDSKEPFKLYVNFEKQSQINNQYPFEPAFNIDEVFDAMPNGHSVIKTGAYASGEQTVQINLRCGSGTTGLVVGDFETSTSKSTVSTPAVTALTENGGGSYDLTIQKGSTPANLATGDIVYFRVKKTSGSDVTDLSNWIAVEGLTE